MTRFAAASHPQTILRPTSAPTWLLTPPLSNTSSTLFFRDRPEPELEPRPLTLKVRLPYSHPDFRQ